MLRNIIRIYNKRKHEQEIYDIFDKALDEDDLLKEYRMYCAGLFLERTGGEYIAKAEEQEKIVVDALVDAWNFVFEVFEKDDIHRLSQLDEDFAYDLKEWYLTAMDRIWCAEEWDKVIAFNQKILSIDWEEADEDVTVTGMANQQIAEAYAKKGYLQKAEILYENYIENAHDSGEGWNSYLIFLAESDPSKLKEKMKELKTRLSENTTRMDDYWLDDVICEFSRTKPSPDYRILQDIYDKRKKENNLKEQ